MTADKTVVNAGELEGATAGAAKGAEPPKPEKITVEGREFEVPPEVAKAIAAARKQAEDTATGAAATEAELRRQLDAAAKPPAKDAGTSPDDLETLLFTNPKEAIRRIEEGILAKVGHATAQTNAQVGFWQQFYEKNPELKAADLVVKAVMGREMGKLGPMTVEKALAHLAEASQAELLKLGVTKKSPKKSNPAEGGTEGVGKSSNDADDENASQKHGLSSVLKDRAAARRKAASGG